MTKRNRRDLAALYPKVELFREAVGRVLREEANQGVSYYLKYLAENLQCVDYWYHEALVMDARQKEGRK